MASELIVRWLDALSDIRQQGEVGVVAGAYRGVSEKRTDGRRLDVVRTTLQRVVDPQSGRATNYAVFLLKITLKNITTTKKYIRYECIEYA